MALTLEQFLQNIQQTVLADSAVEDAEDFVENVFTRQVMEFLAEASEINDGEICYHEARAGRGNVKVNGYVADYDEDRLDLIVSIYTGASSPLRLEKAKVETAFRQTRAFFEQSLNGYHEKIEESSPAFSLAQIIHSLKNKDAPLARVRIFLVTDGVVNVEAVRDEDIGGLPVSHYIRDIEWLFNWHSSGHAQEKIEIDFTQRLGGALRCLMMPVENGEYQTYLAMVPGELLFDIYSDFGARLLERNVRSFLQARGAVNRGIRDTLQKNPHRFLAYNNGLTATAEAVHLSDDGSAIESVSDLQIVNGGQTTASIFQAARRDKVDLSDVYVQMKLSVVQDPDSLDDFVASIAQYANSQNKVNIADFSANAPFHRKMEEHSRTIWAPPAPGSQNQTRWFYERARGQHADARNREGTPAKMKAWDKIHPRNQMFTKTDLAKFENTWMQRPHIVSRGAQKNFAEFTLELGKRNGFEPDTKYFEHMVAKAILFRRAEKIIGAQKYGGYRANIVTYTLAYLAHATQQRLNLDGIWQKQEITPELKLAIETVSKYVFDYITNPPGGRNITEWCKNEKCWNGLKEIEIALPAALQKELVAFGKSKITDNSSIAAPDAEDKERIVAACEYSADAWFALSSWAKATNNLQGWQRGIAFSVGKLIGRGSTPSHKQAHRALEAMEQAKQLGFDPAKV
jgi:hypothetical protein